MPTVLHRAARRLTGRYGAHGSGLILITFAWTVLGVGLMTSTTTPRPGAQLIHQQIPPSVEALIWFGGALLCFSAAIDRDGPRRDGFALGFAVIAPTIRVLSFTWSWVMSLIPGAPEGSPRGWLTAALYLIAVGLVWLVAATPDEEPRQPPTP